MSSRRGSIQRECELCGNAFFAFPNEVAKGWAKYCNATCRYAADRDPRKTRERFFQQVERTDGCHYWTGHKNRFGYGVFWLNGKCEYAHRVAYAFVHGSIPDGSQVNHACDTPSCVYITHLSLGTQSDNMRQMAERGRGVGRRAITEHVVREIHRLLKQGELQQKEIARRFGVSPSTVTDIKTGRSWVGLDSQDCLTPDEQDALLHTMGQQIVEGMAR